MYKDFTNSAESIRRERYRVASTATARTTPGLKIRIGQALVRIGQRWTGAPVLKTDIKSASV